MILHKNMALTGKSKQKKMFHYNLYDFQPLFKMDTCNQELR